MHLVQAGDGDLEYVAALVNSAYRGESSRQGWTTEADYIDGLRTTADILRADLAAKPGSVMLVLREGEGPVGCVWLEPENAQVWYLGMLTVRPDMQDRRLGRVILEGAEQFARDHGARFMRMQVVNLRAELIAWYLRRGYARTGETRPFPQCDGVWSLKRGDLEFFVLEKRL